MRRALIWSVAALLALLLAAAASLVALTHSVRGSTWLLARLPGVSAEGVQGSLLGAAFAAERVEIKGRRKVVIDQLAWRDLRWTWHPHPGVWVGLEIDGASAAKVQVGAATDDKPMVAPTSLRLPVQLQVSDLRVATLELEGLSSLQNLTLKRIELGHDAGRQHRIEGLAVTAERASLRADAELAADAPFRLALRATGASRDGAATPWQGTLDAAGALAAIQAKAHLASPRAAGAALDAEARLTPFEGWPLATLALTVRDLDLASLAAAAPTTRLTGRADVDTRAADAPIGARIALTNALAGRWDQGRLPLAALDAEVTGSLAARQRVVVRRLEARFAGDGGSVGGSVSGSGEWNGARAELKLTLNQLRPAVLDARVAVLALGGQADLKLDGLPAPDGSIAAAAMQRLDLRLALDGRLDAQRDRPLRIAARIEARSDAAAWRAELHDAEVAAGAARLHASAEAEGQRGAAWRLVAKGDLSAFDPTLWWNAPALRAAGPTQLDGRWNATLQVPARGGNASAAASDLRALLAVRGDATLDLGASRIAGVPLQGRLVLDGHAPGWGAQGEWLAAGNRIALLGRFAPSAADDRWRVDVDAPEIAALRPLASAFALRAEDTPWLPSQGKASGQIHLSGRWPALTSSGELQLQDLQSPRARATALRLQWQAGPDADATLKLTLEGQGLGLADGARIDSLSARVDGSLAVHRIALDATTALRPPAWTDALLGARGAVDGSRVKLAGEARWLAAAKEASSLAGSWQARVSELDARPRGPAETLSWLSARDLTLQLRLDTQGRPVEASATPARALLMGAPVQWRSAQWRRTPRGSDFDLDMDVEPLRLAPWLQRVWPNAGLGGDLAVKGRLRVQAAERFNADIVLERASGDLTYSDDEGVAQAFGLTDLRLAMATDDGTWHFTQVLAGANVGVLVGAQSLRLAPSVRWPAPDTPMQGVLEWRVADLGAWARFTPPGWRVAGTLRTSAALGGRFAAPEFSGAMTGNGLAIRNLLLGVDVREGELQLSLRGAEAKVERFSFKGGDGTLRLTGGATLGEQPSADLTLEAERFRVLGRVDRRLVASGNAHLRLAAQSLALDGRFTVDEGLIDFSRGDAPDLDADVRVHGGRWGGADSTLPGPAQRPAGAPRDLRVALELDLGRELKVRGHGLDARIGGRLTVSAPGGRLAVAGSVRTLDGTYAAYGQKLEIERGVLTFSSNLEDPRLDIFALRPNLDVRVGVQVSGSAQSPRVRLVSEPEMSEIDKLSWLVLGRAGEGLGRTDTALLQRAALALLAGDNSDSALLSNLGLDELSVRQTDAGEVRDTVVSVGKQLSRRWFVGYERGVNSTTGTWQLVYRVAQRFTLRARSGEDNALDAIWTWRWN